VWALCRSKRPLDVEAALEEEEIHTDLSPKHWSLNATASGQTIPRVKVFKRDERQSEEAL